MLTGLALVMVAVALLRPRPVGRLVGTVEGAVERIGARLEKVGAFVGRVVGVVMMSRGRG